MARTAQEATQFTALLNKKYRYMDYKWDLVFWVTALPVVAAAADITKLLFAGDWGRSVCGWSRGSAGGCSGTSS